MKKILYILCVFLMLAIGQLSAATHYIGDSASEGTNVTSGTGMYAVDPLTIVMHSGSPTIYTAPADLALTLTEVNFYSDNAGTVIPFVAIYDGVNSTLGSGYEILAIGDTLTVTDGSDHLENLAFTVSGTNPTISVTSGDQIIAGLYYSGKVVRVASTASGVADYIYSGNSITGQSVGDPLSANTTYSINQTQKFNIGFEAAYDIGTDTTVTFDKANFSLANKGAIAAWTDSTLKFNDNAGTDIGVDFTALGINSWTSGKFGNAASTTWDGANLSGLTLTFTGHNFGYNDSFVGVDFSGATIITDGNQPFVSTGFLNLNNANFSGTTFKPAYTGGSLGFMTYAAAAPVLAGADFSKSIWESTATGSLFAIGPGSTSIADMHLAANFSGADFSGLNATVKASVIANLGKFDGGTAIGAKYDGMMLSRSGWTAAELDAAGWQAIPNGSVFRF